MESEKEDILFFFGKSLRSLMRTEADMVQLIVDKFSAFVTYSISEKTLKIPTTAKLGGIVTKWLSTKNGSTAPPLESDPTEALDPLFNYLNENFSALHRFLSPAMNIKVMQKTWEIVLGALEALLLPPLAGKPSSLTPLSPAEKYTLTQWVIALKDFFHHDGKGIPVEELESKRFQEFWMGLNSFYDLSTSDLIRLSEEQASVFQSRNEEKAATVNDQVRRSGTIMAHRNRRALRAEQKKLKEVEIPGTEDIILRILLLRGEHQIVFRRLEQRINLSKSRATS